MVSLYVFCWNNPVTRADVWSANRRFASFVLGIIYIYCECILYKDSTLSRKKITCENVQCTVEHILTQYNGVKFSHKKSCKNEPILFPCDRIPLI